MLLDTDNDIAALLKNTRTIALEIASPKPHRDSYRVLCFLIDQGYEVYPINPTYAGSEIAGCMVYGSLDDVPGPIDLVDIFRRSDQVMPIVSRAIELKAKAIWMQLGVINPDAASLAESAGLDVVMNRCPAIDIPKFRALGLL